MPNDFLGIGWKFPIDADEHGHIIEARYHESISDAIWMIVGTARGERVMRPTFGCGIHDLVFATNSAETRSRVASEVRQALIQWEPRIDVIGVSTTTEGKNPTCLLADIDYRVRATNSRFNLVYPFYLE